MRLTATFQHPAPRHDLLSRSMPAVRQHQGFFRRVFNAIIRSRQVRADREIREILMRHGLTRRAAAFRRRHGNLITVPPR